jgi:hypothetical protein
MAIDFDAIRNKLNQLSGNTKKQNRTWRPQEGEEATVRLLSFPDNDGQPFKELWFYYNIGNNPGLLSPKQFSKPDPIQELINKLRDEGSKESYELAKKLYPKMRCYAPVIVRGQEHEGVRIWSFGKMVYQSLLNIMLDEDYGDITDPLEGRDIKVTCTKAPGRQWATTEVRPRGKQCPLSEDSNQSQAWTDDIPDPGDMFTLKSYDELEKIVNDWLNGDAGNDSIGTTRNTQSTTKATTTAATTTATTEGGSSTKYKSLEDAFADLEDI